MTSNIIHKYGYLLLLSLVIFVGQGCKPNEVDSRGGMPMLAVTLRTINTDSEDRVNSLRMIMAESSTGRVIYNGKPVFPSNNFKQRSEVIEVKNPGMYDFYFFANEDDPKITDAQRQKIRTLMNVAQLFPQEKMTFDPNSFDPSTSYFPMHAVYKNVSVTGGTIDAPQIIPVTLIRNFSKVTINVNRTITTPGAKYAVIKKIYLKNLASQFVPLFAMRTHAEQGLGISTVNSREMATNLLPPYNTAGQIFSQSIYVSELLRTDDDPQGTTVVIEYTKTGDATSPLVTMELPLDIQDIDGLDNVIGNLGMKISPADIQKFTTLSVLRNMHYVVNINISDAQLEPVVRLQVEPWDLIASYFSQTDHYMNASKQDVVMNYPSGDQNSFMILSNFSGNSLSYTVKYDDLGDAGWLSISPISPRVITGNLEFKTTANSENLGGTPRTATVTFHVDGYAHDVSVRIIQLPRQDIVTRKYVNFIGTGGSVTIDVNNHGYDWRADIVENYSTIAGNPDWATVTKSGNQLIVNVKSTNNVNLLRYAVVKVYDGSDRAAYIWVEQGNYKEVTVNGISILDRNLGAINAPTTRSAWSDAFPISNQERVRVNGFYYQWGRVPDGYHWHGIDVLLGNISTSLNSDQLIATPVDYATHPDGMPLKWWDTVVPGSQDPQYGKFITSNPWLIIPSENFPTLWSKPKVKGVDPCPEGYRVPTSTELQTILKNLTYLTSSQGYWVQTSTSGVEAYFPHAGYREFSGALQMWSRDLTQYYTSFWTSDQPLSWYGAQMVFLWNYQNSAQAPFNQTISRAHSIRCIKE